MSEVSSYRFIAGAITGPVVLYSLSKLEIVRRLIKTDYIPGAPTGYYASQTMIANLILIPS